MEDSTQSASPKINARRRLIRGAFSVPAVATIYSGNALAVASNMRCVVTQTTNATYRNAAAATSVADGYVRVPMYVIDNTATGGTLTKYVKGLDLLSKRGTNASILVLANGGAATTSSDWIQLNGTYFAGTTPVVGGKTPTLDPLGKMVAIRVDSSGNIVGIVQGGWTTTTMPANTSAVKGTCWNSFSGLPIA